MEFNMNNLHESAVKAAVRFVERKGCSVVETDWVAEGLDGRIDLIVEDDDELVFMDVMARRSTDGFPESHADREQREVLAAKWLGNHSKEYCDMPIRFDNVSMMVVDGNRAMLRHHINCFGIPEPAM